MSGFSTSSRLCRKRLPLTATTPLPSRSKPRSVLEQPAVKLVEQNLTVFGYKGVKQGSLDFNLISLFPPTYNNRPNGMRVDLMEAIAELNPVSFPRPLA